MNIKRRAKLTLGPMILILTVVVFARYLATHTALLRQLANTPLSVIVGVLALNVVLFGTLAWLLGASLQMYEKGLAARDNFLLSAYSSLVNFFGPGQSGPAVRAAYVKRRVGVGLKQFTFATLIYYGFFAALSGLWVTAGSRPWWQTVIVVSAISSVSFVIVRGFRRKSLRDKATLKVAGVAGIFGAALLQMIGLTAMYAVELHAVHAHASLAQTVTYTGVANFALFVALTPGAIGIRESFLVFSERLHHISSSAIVGANLIDRGVYVLFLGLLFIIVLGLHAKERLHLKSPKS